MSTILVVEDDPDILQLERFNLSASGFAVETATNGEQALKHLETQHVDAIILDIMMPILDGLETIKELRYSRHDNTPIIVASAKGDESDIVTALELGADDYLTKPFSMKVMNSKVKAVLRRAKQRETPEQVLQLKHLGMDQKRHACTVDGRNLELTATEFSLLFLLASHSQQVFTRTQIINMVKGSDYPVTNRSIDVQVATLRKKLGETGSSIKTVWGIGYTYKEEG